MVKPGYGAQPLSYQVIARKWRPFHFDEVTGQSHVTTPLRNAIKSERVPHAILLTGPRGTGKTTLARILACCMNAANGPTDAPARDDPACVDIHAGTSLDVQEIDAASRTSVDDVREIIESVRYAAAPGKWRIFIVDEVHMLSVQAFNSLLKTLEEPPPRSLFIFCTTNPEKIPFTVVSRCQRYDLRRIATAEVASKLDEIAKAEEIEISRASLLAVARAGDGSMRDAQTLLDQLIAFGGGEVSDSRVAEVLDLTDRRVLLDIVAACVEGDVGRALETARHAWDAGVDAKRLGSELLGVVRDLVVMALAPEHKLVEGADAELEALRELASGADPLRLRRMFRALMLEQENLTWAPDPFAVIEMALVRLATMPESDQVDALLKRIGELERRLRGESDGDGAGGAGNTGGGKTQARSRQPADATPDGSSTGADAATGAQQQSRAEIASQTHEATQTPATPEAAAAGHPSDSDDPQRLLEGLRKLCKSEHSPLFSALEGGEVLECSERKLRIGIASPTAQRRLENRSDELEALCARFLGRLKMRVEVVSTGADRKSGNGAAQSTDDGAPPGEDALQRKREAVNHPAVNNAVELLGARILDIRPLGESR